MTRIISTLTTLAILMGISIPGWAINIPPRLVDNRLMIFTGTGTAMVQGCLGGGVPPCAGTTRATYLGQVSGSPFNEFNFFREPEDFSGYLDFSASDYDPETGCYSNVSGVFQVAVYRGQKGRVAFELIATGNSCGSGANTFTGTVSVDSSRAEDPIFRGAVGSGTISLQDDLDLSFLDTGVFSQSVNGQITTRR